MTALAAPVAAATTTETYQADADTYIRWGGAVGETNYGTSTSLFIRQSGDPWGTSTGALYRSLIHFDLSSIPEGATIESATLHGYISSRMGDREVAAYRVTGEWTETDVTWNNAPSNNTQPTSVIDPGPTANVWIGWDVTQDVQAYVQGTPNYGWLLVFPDESTPLTEQRSQLRSREYSDSALRPYLNVTYSTGSVAPVLTVIEVSPAMTNLAVGGTQQFTATAKDQDGIEMIDVTFDWSSSNETVGTVNQTGYFTALAAGTTTVTAAAEGVNGSAMVTTGATPALTTIEVSPETVNLAIGGTRQFNATAKDSAGSEISGVSFDWSSSNETVGTVNETGFFTTLAEGTTTVTAAAEGVNGTAQVTVGPAAQVDLTIAGVVNPALGSAVFAREPNPVVVRNIGNNGEDDATNVVVAVYASDVANGTVAVNTTTIETIPAGSQIAVTNILDPTIRDLQGGTVRYSAAVDPDNLIPETDETNNFKLGFADKSVLYNGYKGKTYWDGGSNVTTARTYDIRGDIVHSFGDSQYMSGSFGTGGWTNYTVTWTAGNLSLPAGATVHDAWLYVPYCWDNSNQAPDNVSIDFNGVRVPYVDWYHDASNFGMYGDHVYGLITYNVTDLYEAGANNTALFTRTDAGAKISPAGFTLAVIYEDDSAARKQIFVNEEFDILGADPQNYGTNMTEATAYVPFSGMTIEKEDVVRANLTTFVPWGNDGEGNLYFNGEQVGAGVWNFGPRTVGASDNSQVAVDEREVTTHLNATGNEAAIQGDETWKSPTMVAGLTFLVVEYADDTAVPTANFTANVTAGEAPLAVQFNDTSTGSPTSWAWDFGDNTTSAEQHPVHTYATAGTYSVNLTVTNAAGSDTETKTDYITVTAPSGGDVPDLTVSTLASNNGEVFSAAGNTYTATITNIGTGDTGAFFVEFNVSGVAGTVTVTDGLAAGANTTVTWTDETVRKAGDIVTITAVVDAENAVTESNEENNRLSIENTVVDNGYRGKRWTGGDDLTTQASFSGRYGVVYSAGDTAYNGASWTERTGNWTVTDLPIPENATIVSARLYQGYTYNKMGGDPAFTLSFNGNTVTPAATYRDVKNFGSYSYPYGLYVYDVTDQFDPAGNSMTLIPEEGNDYGLYGAYLVVVYEDASETEKTIQINDEFDMLYARASYSATSDEATAYASFPSVDTTDLLNARAIAVLFSAGDAEKSKFFFNDREYPGFWIDYQTGPQLGFSAYNVTDAVLDGANEARLQSYDPGSNGDNMYAATAILILEYPAPPGSIFVTSTPAGAAVWLDGEDTGQVTDTTLTNVPAGDHVVTLKLDGYANASTPVTVAEGEMSEVDLALTDRIGCLEVTSTPDGAAIFIDGEDMGEVTNATIDGVGVGNHNVTLKKGGYVDAVAGVTITENETATLHLTLIEATGSIAVTSTPTGATIWIDGIETGRTTDATLTDIPAGEHTVTVKIAGYADAAANVTVEHGETAPVHFGLVPPTGSIAVTSIPDGARIFLDGTETGEMTNATLTNVPPGDHTVRVELDGYQTAEEILTVTAGETVSCHLDLERVMVMPVADFSADVTSGDAPLVVRFTDASTGNATAWAWDFGDGGTSPDQNPVHAYLTAGTYTVTQTVTNADGSNSTMKTGYISVTLLQGEQRKDLSLDVPGCTVTPGSGGSTQVSINTSETGARVTGNTVTVQQAAYTLIIETEDTPTVEDGTITGTIATIRLDTQPVVTELGSVGAVSASVSVDLTGLPDGAGLTTTISQEISPDARSAFQLAAGTDGLDLGDVAYTMNILRTSLENGQDIAGATIRMTVSPAWVEAHGGVDAIRIIRSAEDGTKEVLATRLVGTDAGGNMVFEAASPNGLSLFGLATVSATPQTTQSPASGGGGSSSTAVSAASTLKPGESVTLTVDRTAVSAITLTANSAVNDVMVTMAKGSLPRTAELPAGTVYQYVEATLYKAAVEDFSGIQFRFAVPNTWLAEHGCTAGEVALFRNTGTRWQEIPVGVLDEENGKAVFTANTGGFGLFAITAAGTTPDVGSPTPEPDETETPIGTETAETTAPPADETQATPRPTPLPVWAALLALGLLFFLVRRD
jgi:PGF-pre-PGF domain-containing protein